MNDEDDYAKGALMLKIKMTASERTMLWIKNNPDKVQALKQRQRSKKIATQNESLAAWDVSIFKTPNTAIRGFCHQCDKGYSLRGDAKSIVYCEHDTCPLFAYRNGDPARIKRGRKLNMNNIRKE